MENKHKYSVQDYIMEISAEVDTFDQILDSLTYFLGKDVYIDEGLTESEVYKIKTLKPMQEVRTYNGRFIIKALK